MPREGFDRTDRTNYDRLFSRSDVDSLPFPSLSNDVQLVQLMRDVSHLAPVVANPAAVVTFVKPGVAAEYGALEITAPSDKTIAIRHIVDAAGFTWFWAVDLDPVIFPFNQTAAVIPSATWGDQPVGASLWTGWFTGLPIGVLQVGNAEYDALPIYLPPGHKFVAFASVVNQLLNVTVSFVELG